MRGLRQLIGVDRPGTGVQHRSVIDAVLMVCRECGLTHHDKYSDRDLDDVAPTGRVEPGPRYTRYGFSALSSRRGAFLAKGPEICTALNLPEGSVSIEVEGNTYYVCVAHAHEDKVLLADDVVKAMPRLTPCQVLLGVDIHGDGILLPLADPACSHAAVVSATGGGKTAFMRLMIVTALLSGTRVALFDPMGDKDKGFWPLSGHPLVFRHGMFHGLENIERGLAMLAQRIGRGTPAAPMIIFVDEAGDLATLSKEIKALLARLAKGGRNAGLHLVAGSQGLSTEELGAGAVRNLTARLVGKVADPIAAWQASGRRDSGAELLRGSGDFICVARGQKTRIQVPWASTPWIQSVIPYSPRMANLPPLPDPRQRTVTAAHAAAYTDAGGHGDNGGAGGRNPDDIPAWVIDEIKAYHQTNKGKVPSLRWVERVTKERLPTGGFNRDKAQRAIDQALPMGVM